jgi:hypothetical protein
LGEKFMHDSGATRREIAESYLDFDVIRATRWLAMTALKTDLSLAV